LQADMGLLCKFDDAGDQSLGHEDFRRTILSTLMGKDVVSFHSADVEREDGIWRLTQKLSDNIALKVCVGLLVLLCAMAIFEIDVIDDGPLQGLMQLHEIARMEKAAGVVASTFLCEQVGIYASLYVIMFVYLDGKTYWDRGVCEPTGIDASVLDPWLRMKAVIQESPLRESEIVQSCWPDTRGCSRHRTTSMSLVDQSAKMDATIKSSLWTIAIVILLLLVFVYALNHGVTQFSKRLLQPLRSIVDDMAAMSQLELLAVDRAMPLRHGHQAPKVKLMKELQQLEDACTVMRAAIHSWSQYVPRAVVERLFARGLEAGVGVDPVNVSILFCDIDGFEDACRGLPPSDVLDLLSRALGGISDVIDKHKGTLLEFIGDEVLAVFNTPNNLKHYTFEAVSCALAIHIAVKAMPLFETSTGEKIQIRCRCSVNTCTILAGNIGSSKRLKYGLLGDGINLTARLKGINSRYKTQTLVSEKVTIDEKTRDFIVSRPIDLVAVKGKTEPTTVFEPLILRSRLDDDRGPVEDAALKHVEAFDFYKLRHFIEAYAAFEDAHQQFAALGRDDEPSRMLKVRCQRYIENPPPVDWDGVERLTKK